MSHYDQDTLALLSLGEHGVTTDDGAHLDTCDRCRHEVDRLAAVVVTARQVSAPDRPQTPPAEVWQRILADIAEPATAAPLDLGSREPGVTAIVRPRDGSTPAATTRRLARRRGPWAVAAAAAVVGLLVGAGAEYGITRPATPAAAAPAARVVLQPLDTPAAHGTAVLDHGTGARRVLTVRVQGLPAVPGTFYEVWLMNANPQRLLSLGVLDSSESGRFEIPAGLDLGRYPVVDISLQTFNGSPAHSGTSAVRGTIPS